MGYLWVGIICFLAGVILSAIYKNRVFAVAKAEEDNLKNAADKVLSKL